jgi:hypothetical protein
MSVTPADLYSFSLTTTAATQPGEVMLRAGISRAYYASYHGCAEWHEALPTKGHNVGPVGGKHQQLINQLCNPSSIADFFSKSLGYGLRDLRIYRITADYDLGASMNADYAEEAQAKACTLLKKLKLVP